MSFSRQITVADGATAKINTGSASSPTTSNDNTQGYGVGSLWMNTSTGQIWHCRDVTTNAAVWLQMELSDHPGYIVGNYYIPSGIFGLTPGNAATANIAMFAPCYIKERVTLNALGIRINTLAAAGNVQCAVYANNLATMRPTGSPLVSTSSLSTAAAGNINTAISTQLEAGLYWFGTNTDNSTVILESILASSAQASIGSATANRLQSGASFLGTTAPLTFGTWGDISAATFTDTSSPIPVIQFKVGSVP